MKLASSLVATAILCHSATAQFGFGRGGRGGGRPSFSDERNSLHNGIVKDVEDTAKDVASTVQGLLGARQADPQTSLQLDPSIIGPNLANNGLAGATEAGQAPSLTSTNNFINFCVGKTIMNGLQGPNGQQLCNPVPMGDIPSNSTMIACKFQSPPNFGTLKTNTSFDIVMAVNNFQTGDFVNPNTNYFAAPQQLNAQGQIIGHSHFVVEPIKSLTDISVTDPTKFAYFKGVNSAAVGGKLTVTLTEGLPAGTYRIASINTAGNHQPALVPVAQHGSLDDMIYITVTDDGQADNNATDTTSALSSTTDSAAASSTDSALVTTASSVADSTTAISSAAATDVSSSVAASATGADSTTAVSSAASTTDSAAATDVSSSIAVSVTGAGDASTAATAIVGASGKGRGKGFGAGGFGGFGGRNGFKRNVRRNPRFAVSRA